MTSIDLYSQPFENRIFFGIPSNVLHILTSRQGDDFSLTLQSASSPSPSLTKGVPSNHSNKLPIQYGEMICNGRHLSPGIRRPIIQTNYHRIGPWLLDGALDSRQEFFVAKSLERTQATSGVPQGNIRTFYALMDSKFEFKFLPHFESPRLVWLDTRRGISGIVPLTL